MPQGDQSLKPKVFLSYTGSQRDVARSFKAQLVRWGFEEVFDWIDDPVRAGPLWATMEEKLDTADVLVSFICEDYGDKIAGRELNWFTENSSSDQKRTILVFLHKDGKAWWKGLDLPDPLQDLVQNRLYDETSGRRRPPHKVDESGVIRGDTDDYQKFYRDVIDYLNEWWAEKPEPETKPEPEVGKDIMVVMGSCEGTLSDQAGEGRETLLSALQAEAAQGDVIVLDDNWGAPRKRNPIIAQMMAHPNRNRQALLVAPQPLDEMFEAGYGKVVFDEVRQVLGYGAPEKPRLASPFVWLPGYSHD
ncbi:MAG: toll/interleukin-1 receptor domain-containing protein, partial [Pseudomonadota bacterium]